MEIKEIKDLIKQLDDSSLFELVYKQGDTELRLRKAAPQNLTTPVLVTPTQANLPLQASAALVAPPAVLPPVSAPASVQSSTTSATPSVAGSSARTDLYEQKSPMVGTLYTSSSPDAPAYVKIGDRVQKGQVLCIIEAMKLMNEIEAETDGILEEIAVPNESPVEFGTVLFRIKK